MTPADYDLLRSGRGLIERNDRARLALTGGDRRSFLQGLVTNDVLALGPGQSCYAAMLTPQGRMMTDLYVHETGDQLLLDIPRERASALAARFDQSIFSEDAAVRDVSAEWRHLTCPEGSDLALSQLARSDPAGGTPGIVVARGLPFDVPLIDLFVPAPDASAALEAMQRAGLTPVGQDAFEILRVESGVPRWGVDMTEETIPLEAGIDQRAISLTKGCYVGQEVIIRVLHRGHGRVARRLVRLALTGAAEETLPSRGEGLKAADREVGRLTSVAWSPRLGGIALGYVHRDFVEPGTEVTYSGGRAVVGGT
jgi:tRNA-modifying protein YgfZ